MSSEKRRYFRITETVGISYELIDKPTVAETMHDEEQVANLWDLISEQDKKIETLLIEIAKESPKVAELVETLNLKLERITRQLIMDSKLVDKLANRVKEVSISACGLAFVNDLDVPLNTRISLELKLMPKNTIVRTNGIVVACDQLEEGYFWRIDFYDIKQVAQEALIQHIVQRQSEQLRTKTK